MMADADREWRPLLFAMTSERTKSIVDRDWKNRLRKINLDDNLLTLFGVLADNQILAAVVVDSMDRYHGFVYMLDLVNFIVDAIDMRSYGPFSANTKQRLQETTVASLVSRPLKREVHTSYSLFHSFEQMAIGGQKYMALVDSGNRPVGVLTQSMLIRYLNDHIGQFGAEIAQCPLWQIRNYTTVLTVRPEQTALSAFRLMADRRFDGLGVVDNDDKLVDVISVSDLRGLDPHKPNFWKLYDSVRTFKESVRKAYPFSVPWTAIAVSRNDTFESIVRKMATQRIHRVFIVTDTNRLLDIITQTDVLMFVLSKIESRREA